ISRAGLKARNILDFEGRSEAAFLDRLEPIVESGITAADDLLARYHGRWGGDLSRVFAEEAY
ncbi:MAG: glutamate--cysteine ligase, partial [Hyphomicrobiales bacterium]